MDSGSALQALHDFHFLRSWFLLGLLPLCYILKCLWNNQVYRSNWQNVCDHHLLKHLLISQAVSYHRLPILCIALCWIFAIFALAGPTWHQSSHTVYRAMLPQIIAVDLSDAMYATDLRPNRIERARYKLLDIVKQQKEGRTGMIAFTQEAYTVSPLTEDAATLSALIPELDPKIMPISGSNLTTAMKYAAKLLQQTKESKGNIILVTASTPVMEDYRVAEEINKLGYSISVYAVGTPQGAPLVTEQGFKKDKYGNIILSKLEVTKLRHLAQNGGGMYIPFSDDDGDTKMVAKLLDVQDGPSRQSSQKIQQWQDRGRLWILLILPLAALAFRKGWFETIAT
jgi:Ca-activated chloride channel homolog